METTTYKITENINRVIVTNESWITDEYFTDNRGKKLQWSKGTAKVYGSNGEILHNMYSTVWNDNYY